MKLIKWRESDGYYFRIMDNSEHFTLDWTSHLGLSIIAKGGPYLFERLRDRMAQRHIRKICRQEARRARSRTLSTATKTTETVDC
jgi:hypothetical protein